MDVVERKAEPAMKSRLDGVWRWLQRNRSEEDLFSASCLVAEMLQGVHASSVKDRERLALQMLTNAARDNGLWLAVGRERVRRTITNGLVHVERKARAQIDASTPGAG